MTSAAVAGSTGAMPPVPALSPTQHLSFLLGSETFAIGIRSIKEIIGYHGVTPVPMMPPAVRGVLNLRGAVVPVMDLQARFGRASSPPGKKTCVVIVEIAGAGDERQVLGVVVDAVNEVLDIPAADIEPPPAFGSRIRADFVHGMGKVRGRFVVVIDVERALSLEEIGGPQQQAAVH